jgi:hypothetical protein
MNKLIKSINVASAMQIGGASSVSAGCFLVAAELGFVISGLFLLLFGVAVGARKD